MLRVIERGCKQDSCLRVDGKCAETFVEYQPVQQRSIPVPHLNLSDVAPFPSRDSVCVLHSDIVISRHRKQAESDIFPGRHRSASAYVPIEIQSDLFQYPAFSIRYLYLAEICVKDGEQVSGWSWNPEIHIIGNRSPLLSSLIPVRIRDYSPALASLLVIDHIFIFIAEHIHVDIAVRHFKHSVETEARINLFPVCHPDLSGIEFYALDCHITVVRHLEPIPIRDDAPDIYPEEFIRSPAGMAGTVPFPIKRQMEDSEKTFFLLRLVDHQVIPGHEQPLRHQQLLIYRYRLQGYTVRHSHIVQCPLIFRPATGQQHAKRQYIYCQTTYCSHI